MNKNIVFLGLLIVVLVTGFASKSYAVTLLTQEAAIKEMFPDADKVTPEVKTLTPEQITAVKGKLGGSLVHIQKGSQSAEIKEKVEFTFYKATKGDKLIGVALIDEQPGKWGVVQFIVNVDPATIKVKNMAVMSYVEKRGRPIAGGNFMSQFFGKGTSDPIAVRKDIRAISGATISSEATCFAVKKVLLLVETVYPKK